MGWQLPSLAELTSVDSEDWTKQRAGFEQYKIPASNRSEIDFWTSSPWLGRSDSWSVVQFSARTTIAHAVAPDSKAAVWCVRALSRQRLALGIAIARGMSANGSFADIAARWR